MRFVKELFLIPRFCLIRMVTHFAILNCSYRGISPEIFREKWKYWIEKEKTCLKDMNDLPELSPAVPIMNSIIAGAAGSFLMRGFDVSWEFVVLFLLCLLMALLVYLERTRIKPALLMTAILQMPVYLLRVLIALFTSNLIRLLISVTVTLATVLFLNSLSHFLSWTFLFYHLEFGDLTLTFLLALVVAKKVLYLVEILWNREKYFANIQRMKYDQEISWGFFYKDLTYSFCYGVAGGMFGTAITYGLLVVLIEYIPTIDLRTPIGIAVLVLLQYYVQQSGFQEYKFYTNHKYMHARPYFNILHMEHHFAFPSALIGYGEAGYLESTVQILFFCGSLPGLSGLIYTIEFTNNEMYHAFHSRTWMKELRELWLRLAAIPGELYASFVRFVIRSKSQGATPMAYCPGSAKYAYIDTLVDVEQIRKDDIEFEVHGQHHWFNAPLYGEGLTDYYMGKEYNSDRRMYPSTLM